MGQGRQSLVGAGAGTCSRLGRHWPWRRLACLPLLLLCPLCAGSPDAAPGPSLFLPPTPQQAYRLWKARCQEQLRAAQKAVAPLAPEVGAGQLFIRQSLDTHGNDEAYPHETFGFTTPDIGLANGQSFRVTIRVRESEHEDNEIPAVWYPTIHARIPVSPRRFYQNESYRLVPIDEATSNKPGTYSYHRRSNHVIARVWARRRPADLPFLLQHFEPAVEACLAEGRTLPPLPCPRLVALPPRPRPAEAVYRPEPPLTIEVRGLPRPGELSLSLGDWHQAEWRPKLAAARGGSDEPPLRLQPVSWFVPFQTRQRLSYAFEPRPPEERPVPHILLGTATSLPIDGRETSVRVRLSFDQAGQIAVESERHLPPSDQVRLTPDWTPEASGEPAYLLRNGTPSRLRGTGPSHSFATRLESLLGGGWQAYPPVVNAETPKEAGRPQKACGNVELVEHPGIDPGDWDFVRHGQPLRFEPGRYRFVVEYELASDPGPSQHRSLSEVAAEFQIPAAAR